MPKSMTPRDFLREITSMPLSLMDKPMEILVSEQDVSYAVKGFSFEEGSEEVIIYAGDISNDNRIPEDNDNEDESEDEE